MKRLAITLTALSSLVLFAPSSEARPYGHGPGLHHGHHHLDHGARRGRRHGLHHHRLHRHHIHRFRPHHRRYRGYRGVTFRPSAYGYRPHAYGYGGPRDTAGRVSPPASALRRRLPGRTSIGRSIAVPTATVTRRPATAAASRKPFGIREADVRQPPGSAGDEGCPGDPCAGSSKEPRASRQASMLNGRMICRLGAAFAQWSTDDRLHSVSG